MPTVLGKRVHSEINDNVVNHLSSWSSKKLDEDLKGVNNDITEHKNDGSIHFIVDDISPPNSINVFSSDKVTNDIAAAVINTVDGPVSSTDNTIARFDGVSGKLIQDSSVTVTDTGNIELTGTVDGRFVNVDGSTLDSLVTNAVLGPPTSTTYAIPRYSDTSGKSLQNTSVSIDGLGNIVLSGTVDGREVGGDGATLDYLSANAVKGLSTSSDNVIARYNGDTGREVQDSKVEITDVGTLQPVVTGQDLGSVASKWGSIHGTTFYGTTFNGSNSFNSGMDTTFGGSLTGKIDIDGTVGNGTSTTVATILIGSGNCGSSLTNGGNNICMGWDTLSSATTSVGNTCIGNRTGRSITTFGESVFVGNNCGRYSQGAGNVGIGAECHSTLTDGFIAHYNTAIGHASGQGFTSARGNVLLGAYSGQTITIGKYNTALGYITTVAPGVDNQTALGYGATCTVANQIVLGDSAIESFAIGSDIKSDLGDGTHRFLDVYYTGSIATSDGNLKQNVDDFNNACDWLGKLKPKVFKWKDGKRDHYGFISQDFEKLIENKDINDSGVFVKIPYVNEEHEVVDDSQDEVLEEGKEEKKSTRILQKQIKFSDIEAYEAKGSTVNYNYGIRYEELIAPLVRAVQELTARVAFLEANK